MNYILQRMFILGLVIAGCGSGKDNRILLSSQSKNDELIIPSGSCEDCIVSRQKFERTFTKKFGRISEVFRISFSRSPGFFGFFSDQFDVSLSMRTRAGAVYSDVQCVADAGESILYLYGCASDQVVFRDFISILLNDILVFDARR